MKLVILDRDGVINKESDAYIKNPDEWHLVDGSAEAIARFNDAGWKVVVASNQSGIGRGLFSQQDLEAIHSRMREVLERYGAHTDEIFICPHHPDDNCDCRKPKPGLLWQIAARYGCPLAGVPIIGDSERDLRAAIAVGARPIMVLTGHARSVPDALSGKVEVFPDLAGAADHLLTESPMDA